MRVTMRDVARAAGVSVTTVSYVLSRRSGVSISRPTCDRVLQEARRLNYRHNALAADLRRGETRLVGIQLYSLAVPIVARKVTALERALRAAGLYPFLCHVFGDVEAERAFYQECASRRVRGLVLTAPPSRETRPYLRQLIAGGVPILSTEPVLELGLPYVTVDRAGGAETAVAHLLGLGHRRIAAVVGFTGRARENFVAGYRRGLDAARVTWDPALVLDIRSENGWYGAGVQAVERLLELREPPTAIITTDDEVAIGALRGLQRRGLRVPRDVALVGCDDDAAAAYADVPLTTLAQPAEEVGVTLARLFTDALEDPERVAGRAVMLPMKLIIRESCGSVSRDGAGALSPGCSVK
jgi:LacI family transcriptional regulator, repressor for deo operon, udp, cdd, tsx, nupC, and nupG